MTDIDLSGTTAIITGGGGTPRGGFVGGQAFVPQTTDKSLAVPAVGLF